MTARTGQGKNLREQGTNEVNMFYSLLVWLLFAQKNQTFNIIWHNCGHSLFWIQYFLTDVSSNTCQTQLCFHVCILLLIYNSYSLCFTILLLEKYWLWTHTFIISSQKPLYDVSYWIDALLWLSMTQLSILLTLTELVCW